MNNKKTENAAEEGVQKEELPSRTQLKKEAIEMQALGEQLLELKSTDLNKIPLQDRVLAAIAEYKKLPNSHGAKKRQRQYIGKVMRDCDSSEIRKAISALQAPTPANFKTRSLISEIIDDVLENGDDGINRILSEHSGLQRQKLRQLLREFSKDSETDRVKYQRKLEKYIRESITPED
jgi:ribosome-associated protein